MRRKGVTILQYEAKIRLNSGQNPREGYVPLSQHTVGLQHWKHPETPQKTYIAQL